MTFIKKLSSLLGKKSFPNYLEWMNPGPNFEDRTGHVYEYTDKETGKKSKFGITHGTGLYKTNVWFGATGTISMRTSGKPKDTDIGGPFIFMSDNIIEWFTNSVDENNNVIPWVQPEGVQWGWEDFCCDFNTVEEAELFLKNEIRYCDWDKAQIVDTETSIMVRHIDNEEK